MGNSNLTIIDDGTTRGVGSAQDGEGLPTRRKTVFDKGVLTSYLLNTYTARKLNAVHWKCVAWSRGARESVAETLSGAGRRRSAIPMVCVTDLIGHGVDCCHWRLFS